MKPKPIPIQTEGYLINPANNVGNYVRIVGYEAVKDRLYHQFQFILKDGTAYGGGSFDLNDTDHFIFKIDDGEEGAVCADHE